MFVCFFCFFSKTWLASILPPYHHCSDKRRRPEIVVTAHSVLLSASWQPNQFLSNLFINFEVYVMSLLCHIFHTWCLSSLCLFSTVHLMHLIAAFLWLITVLETVRFYDVVNALRTMACAGRCDLQKCWEKPTERADLYLELIRGTELCCWLPFNITLSVTLILNTAISPFERGRAHICTNPADDVILSQKLMTDGPTYFQINESMHPKSSSGTLNQRNWCQHVTDPSFHLSCSPPLWVWMILAW